MVSGQANAARRSVEASLLRARPGHGRAHRPFAAQKIRRGLLAPVAAGSGVAARVARHPACTATVGGTRRRSRRAVCCRRLGRAVCASRSGSDAARDTTCTSVRNIGFGQRRRSVESGGCYRTGRESSGFAEQSGALPRRGGDRDAGRRRNPVDRRPRACRRSRRRKRAGETPDRRAAAGVLEIGSIAGDEQQPVDRV